MNEPNLYCPNCHRRVEYFDVDRQNPALKRCPRCKQPLTEATPGETPVVGIPLPEKEVA